MPRFLEARNGGMSIEADSQPTRIAAIGNITVHPKRITHHIIIGAALALTIDAPLPADDGKIMTFFSDTAAAHVITQAVVGFNGKGAAGTATWAGVAIGELLVLIAHNGNWWTLAATGVVIA